MEAGGNSGRRGPLSLVASPSGEPEWRAAEWPARVSPSEGEGEQGGGWVVVSRVAAQVADNVGRLNVGHLTANW